MKYSLLLLVGVIASVNAECEKCMIGSSACGEGCCSVGTTCSDDKTQCEIKMLDQKFALTACSNEDDDFGISFGGGDAASMCKLITGFLDKFEDGEDESEAPSMLGNTQGSMNEMKAMSGLMKDNVVHIRDEASLKISKWVSAFDASAGSNAVKCKMGVDFKTSGDKSFVEELGAGTPTTYIGVCGGPTDLASKIFGNDNIYKGAGLNLACTDSSSCKCGAIATAMSYKLDIDETKFVGKALKMLGKFGGDDLKPCIEELMTKMLKAMEGKFSVKMSSYACVSGDLEVGEKSLNLPNPMENVPEEIRKQMADFGVKFSMQLKANIKVRESLAVDDLDGKVVTIDQSGSGETATVLKVNSATSELVVSLGGSEVTVDASKVQDVVFSDDPAMPYIPADGGSGASTLGLGFALVATLFATLLSVF